MIAVSETQVQTTAGETKRRWTYAELVAEMPETNQLSELWDGILLPLPSPSVYHQDVVARILLPLHDHVHRGKLGKVVAAPVDMVLSQHRVVQPDVAFIAKDRLGIIGRAINGPADLVLEIISLGGRQRDRIEKRDLYEQYGVKEYWIVDPEAQTVEVLFLEQGRYQLAGRFTPGQTAASRLLPGFEISVQALLHED